MAQRPPKKSDTLELRLPHADKQAFMALCRARGVGASETVRRLIAEELRPAPPAIRRTPLRWRRTAAVALAGLAAGAAAAPVLAHTAATAPLAACTSAR